MGKAVDFWGQFLDIEPHKKSANWCEFMVKDLRFALLLNDFGDKFSGSNCVPVFEFDDRNIIKYLEKAKKLGAVVVVDALNDPNMKSVALKDPEGNEFELSKLHE